MWANNWGEEFNTEEEARENVLKHIERDDYEYELQYLITHDQLLKWAMNQEAFYEAFKNEINKAEDEFFQDNYFEVEDD